MSADYCGPGLGDGRYLVRRYRVGQAWHNQSLHVVVVDGATSAELFHRDPRPADARFRRGDLPPIRIEPSDAVVIRGQLSAEACRAIREHCLAAGLIDGGATSRDMCELGGVADIVAAGHSWVNAVREVGWPHLPELFTFGVQALRYRPGIGKARHMDGALDPAVPWIGLVVALSSRDEYEGGELVVELDDGRRETVRLDQGDFVVLPGHLPHSVTKVTAGERWTLTSFYRPAAEPAP